MSTGNLGPPIVLRTVRPLPDLRLWEGETVVIRDGRAGLWRPLDMGAIDRARSDGAFEVVSGLEVSASLPGPVPKRARAVRAPSLKIIR